MVKTKVGNSTVFPVMVALNANRGKPETLPAAPTAHPETNTTTHFLLKRYLTYNILEQHMPQPKPDDARGRRTRSAIIGTVASVVSAAASNSFRVLKVYRCVRRFCHCIEDFYDEKTKYSAALVELQTGSYVEFKKSVPLISQPWKCFIVMIKIQEAAGSASVRYNQNCTSAWLERFARVTRDCRRDRRQAEMFSDGRIRCSLAVSFCIDLVTPTATKGHVHVSTGTVGYRAVATARKREHIRLPI